MAQEETYKYSFKMEPRTASLFVQTASKFDSDIVVSKDSETANGKSLMSMLVLSAVCGSKLKITASGPDAEDAVKALNDLVDRRFDEE